MQLEYCYEIVTHTHTHTRTLSFISPLSLVQCSPLHCSPVFCWFHAGGGSGGWYHKLSVCGVLCQEEYDVHVDDFFFVPLGSTWDHFYMFAETLFSFSTGLQLHVTSKSAIPGAISISYLFVLFVPLNPVLSSSMSALWLTMGKLFAAALLYATSCASTSQGLCSPTRSVSVSALSSCYCCIHLTPHRVTTCHCCLYKTMVVPHKQRGAKVKQIRRRHLVSWRNCCHS